jgi:bacteriorhodopsin
MFSKRNKLLKWIFFAISFAFFINISTDANANAELREQIKEEYPTEKLIEIFLAYKKDATEPFG